MKRKKEIEDAGLIWSVVENVPVNVQKRTGDFEEKIDNYKNSPPLSR